MPPTIRKNKMPQSKVAATAHPVPSAPTCHHSSWRTSVRVHVVSYLLGPAAGSKRLPTCTLTQGAGRRPQVQPIDGLTSLLPRYLACRPDSDGFFNPFQKMTMTMKMKMMMKMKLMMVDYVPICSLHTWMVDGIETSGCAYIYIYMCVCVCVCVCVCRLTSDVN
ncbi:hypothetical protein IWZ03DRAFT_247371 [Phyllosticta citriasiana]|uniref:Uncharacterized protein n=1 Tax=Phyllosticta citriasiana TaxID=595635 RepID=A0ABR1KJM9_9PEZI